MSLTLIGDVDQLLFRFAGAKPEIMTEEVDKWIPDIKTHKLLVNYRSTKEIVNRSNDLISYNYGDKGGIYPQWIMKDVTTRPNAADGERIVFTEFEDSHSEADGVLNTIRELSQTYPYDSFFVAARTRAQLAYSEIALGRGGIPFINIAGGSFFSMMHVADVVAYLALAIDQNDNQSFLRIYNKASSNFRKPFGNDKGEYCHHRFLGNAFLSACNNSYNGMKNLLFSNDSWRYEAGINDIIDLVDEIKTSLNDNGLIETLSLIESHYTKHYAADRGILVEDQGGILDDFTALNEVASSFENARAFIAYAKTSASATKDQDWSGKVVLSTIHGLKGLERDVVIVLGFSEGETKTGQLSGLLPHTFSLTNPPVFGVLPTGGKGLVEDERCMAYVAITRAKERVFLFSVQNYQNKHFFGASRFLNELNLQ